jgi:hypothetical protein
MRRALHFDIVVDQEGSKDTQNDEDKSLTSSPDYFDIWYLLIVNKC